MKNRSFFSEPSELHTKARVIRNLLARFPLICLCESPRSGGVNAKSADSSTFHRSSGWNLARSSLIWACSNLTVAISTNPASPCFWISLSLCLFKCESQFHQFTVHSRKTEWLNPPWSREPFVFWHIQSLLICFPLCHEHMAIHNLSLPVHLLNPEPQCMIHIQSCDNAFGIEFTWASISGHCHSLRDSVDWVNNNAPWGLVAKYFTTSPWLIGCGRVSTYVYTVIQSKRVRFSHFAILIGCVEVFGVSVDGPGLCSQPHLATWMGCFWHLCFHSSWGMVMEEGETAHIDFKTIQMPNFFLFPCDYSWSWPIGCDWPWLVSENLAYFQISYCIIMPKGYAVFVMQ